ncbi:helix-turn-helix transcriptional regulator [Hassallia byssoidea VB512170]|uniref:Helix-turn-helix transcriptional regulator n=1 Tax=Hassallia byssoidea VB512170 TaxID=1304833 RepID=A0A846H8K7_9CYAN|nr:AraC family transcriptional regulator [Hassalia byssoidea]NEU73413.1 helix-turn-helix transcriptional regulator [Hassalia byssoidea VB512170]
MAQQQQITIIDYRQADASNLILPKSPIVSSKNAQWSDIHFELQQQPTHDTTEHLHCLHILTYICSPTPLEQWIDGKLQQLVHGNTFILPAGVLHRCQWLKDIEFMFVGIEPSLFNKVGQELVKSDHIELKPHFATLQDPLIQGILSAFKDELVSGGIAGNLFIEQLKTTLITHLLRKYSVFTPQISTSSDGLPKYKLQKVIEYINAHLQYNLRLAEIAAIAQLSEFYFCRLFKQSMNMSVHQYVIQQRVERAKQLLLQGQMPIIDIALACGFANQSHLNLHFKRLTGVTPKTVLENRYKPDNTLHTT